MCTSGELGATPRWPKVWPIANSVAARRQTRRPTRVLLAVAPETDGDHDAAVAMLRSSAVGEPAEQTPARLMRSGLGSPPQPNRGH
jgi:hypothetical protein